MSKATCPACGSSTFEYCEVDHDYIADDYYKVVWDCTCKFCGHVFTLKEFFVLREQAVDDGDWFTV